jgi:hypothetical protein
LPVSLQTLALGLSPDAVGLCVLDRRRMALDADPELDAQVERFLVREPQLTGKLVDADLLGQLWASVLSELRARAAGTRCDGANYYPRTSPAGPWTGHELAATMR